MQDEPRQLFDPIVSRIWVRSVFHYWKSASQLYHTLRGPTREGLAGRLVMASLPARAADTVSGSWSSPVARIWRGVRRSLSFSNFRHRSYSDEGLDSRVPRNPVASLDTTLSGEFLSAVSKIETFGADKPVNERNAYRSRSYEGLRVYQTVNFNALSGELSHLKNCQQQGIVIHSNTFVHFLKRCLKRKDYAAARQVHDLIIQIGMDKNPHVATTLLNVYITCGRLQDARRVFDRLEKKSVLPWSLMVRGYAKMDHAEDAMEIFNRMLQRHLLPDRVTYLSILKACATPLALKWGKEVHANIRNAGLESDVRIATALIQMYGKCGCITEARRVFETMINRDVITLSVMISAYAACGSIDDARLVFDRMEKRDVIAWNVMIGAYAASGYGVEAYRLFLQMIRERFIPDAITYVSILNASASAESLEWLKDVHSRALEAGLLSNSLVSNAIIHMYAKSGSIDDARLVFNSMKTRDLITWNVMIGAYAKSDYGVEAYRLFLQMQRESFKPDAITYMSIQNASPSIGALEWVKEVHGHARRAGLESDLRVGSALVHMYARSGSISDARQMFLRLKARDAMTWNIMIGAHAECGFGLEAYRLFLQMKREGFKPDAYTYASILNASASVGALEWVKDVHRDALEAGLESDLRVGNALVHMYAKCGRIDDAQLVFHGMEERDVFTWNIMIGAYAESGGGVEAYQLFLQMKRKGFKPDAATYVGILHASASAGGLEWVKEVHSQSLKSGLDTDLRVGNALIHMYAINGSIDDARLVFDRMEKRDVVTFNIMIGGLAQHGCGYEALKLFRKMNAVCVNPNATSFAAVLSACCHAGLLDDGRRLFSAMTQDYAIEPDVMHYTSLVDLLGRAGHLEEAKLVVGDMPVEADAVIWRTLLGSCRTHGNVKLGELAAKEALNLEPKNCSTYVLLSNIYAGAGTWEKVSSVRTIMRKRGVSKEPGRSWIEVDNKIHEFVSCDTSHPEAKAIYAQLNKLTEKLKASGYVPDIQLVLRDIAEGDKELSLCSHSEKLAIAYGLISLPHGKPVRVFKNLRVCTDCHTATKLISKVTGREIIARDANRFHHFKDGVCSCGDYW